MHGGDLMHTLAGVRSSAWATYRLAQTEVRRPGGALFGLRRTVSCPRPKNGHARLHQGLRLAHRCMSLNYQEMASAGFGPLPRAVDQRDSLCSNRLIRARFPVPRNAAAYPGTCQ